MTDRGTTIVVDLHDALPDVLTRLRAISDGEVRIAIPSGSSLFLTATEFRALKATAEQNHLILALATTDPLRQQLAAMFTIALADDSPAASPTTQPRRPVEDQDQGETPGAGSWPNRPVIRELSPDISELDEDDGPSWIAVAPDDETEQDSTVPSSAAGGLRRVREHRRVRSMTTTTTEAPASAETVEIALPSPPPAAKPGWASYADPPSTAVTGETDVDQDPERPFRPRRRVSRRALTIGAATLVAVALVGSITAYLLLPRATVTLYLQRQPVSAELTYLVAATGAADAGAADLLITAQPFSFDVAADYTAPTTGTQRIPDATAAGRIRLSNPNPEALTIPAGTVVATDTGIEYRFIEDVAVPAADPDEGLFGRAEGPVQATEPGSTGNIETGALSGQLDSGVYFSNRDGPIEGGTDREVRVVAAADLDALRSKAEAELPPLIDQTAAQKLPTGQEILPAAVERSEIAYTFDHEEGDEAGQLSVHAVLPVTALAHSPAQTTAQVTAAIDDRLAAAAPNGFAISAATVTIADPQPEELPDAMRYRITATADATPVLSDDQRDEIARDVAGKSEEDAEAIVRQIPSVERVEIDFSPSWLPARLPRSSGRIDVEPAP